MKYQIQYNIILLNLYHRSIMWIKNPVNINYCNLIYRYDNYLFKTNILLFNSWNESRVHVKSTI